jgi:uncharacterized protein YaiI (UPF0178 family)
VASIYLDADACPVRDEVYRLALRRDVKVYAVSHGPLRVPARGRVEHVRVQPGLDAADDWIAGHAAPGDVVVTADIPLAARCIRNGAQVIAPDGTTWTEASIGDALAGRDLKDQLRLMGIDTGGPAPFAAADRSRFLARLGEALRAEPGRALRLR